jgi:hypothetical protein
MFPQAKVSESEPVATPDAGWIGEIMQWTQAFKSATGHVARRLIQQTSNVWVRGLGGDRAYGRGAAPNVVDPPEMNRVAGCQGDDVASIRGSVVIANAFQTAVYCGLGGPLAGRRRLPMPLGDAGTGHVPELGVCGLFKVDVLVDRVGGVQPGRLGAEAHRLAVEADRCSYGRSCTLKTYCTSMR